VEKRVGKDRGKPREGGSRGCWEGERGHGNETLRWRVEDTKRGRWQSGSVKRLNPSHGVMDLHKTALYSAAQEERGKTRDV